MARIRPALPLSPSGRTIGEARHNRSPRSCRSSSPTSAARRSSTGSLPTTASAVLGEGRVERIGQPGSGVPRLRHRHPGGHRRPHPSGRPAGQPVRPCAPSASRPCTRDPSPALGSSTTSVLAAMEAVTFLAPAHNPPYVAAMRSFRRVLPQTPLVALFETAFFDRMPDSATTYAVPYEWKEQLGIRRYGFHGASHRAAAERVAGAARASRARTSPVTWAAAPASRPFATASPSKPASACPRSRACRRTTASGDLDVFAALFVMKQRGLDPDAMAKRCSRRGRGSRASAA